jgi:hypothetical protein
MDSVIRLKYSCPATCDIIDDEEAPVVARIDTPTASIDGRSGHAHR